MAAMIKIYIINLSLYHVLVHQGEGPEPRKYSQIHRQGDGSGRTTRGGNYSLLGCRPVGSGGSRTPLGSSLALPYLIDRWPLLAPSRTLFMKTGRKRRVRTLESPQRPSSCPTVWTSASRSRKSCALSWSPCFPPRTSTCIASSPRRQEPCSPSCCKPRSRGTSCRVSMTSR